MAKRFLSGIDSPYVKNLDPPLFPKDAVNKEYVDNITKGRYMKRLIDEVDDNILYIGEAAPGSADDESVWAIRKVQFIGDDIAITWANSVNTYNNRWDMRLNYTYN